MMPFRFATIFCPERLGQMKLRLRFGSQNEEGNEASYSEILLDLCTLLLVNIYRSSHRITWSSQTSRSFYTHTEE